MIGDTPSSDRCAKPGCGALKRIGNPCTDWDCPQRYVTAADYRTLLDHIAALEERAIKAEAALAAHATPP